MRKLLKIVLVLGFLLFAFEDCRELLMLHSHPEMFIFGTEVDGFAYVDSRHFVAVSIIRIALAVTGFVLSLSRKQTKANDIAATIILASLLVWGFLDWH